MNDNQINYKPKVIVQNFLLQFPDFTCQKNADHSSVTIGNDEETLESIQSMLLPQIIERLRRTFPQSCPRLRADRRMVKQMLINLLGNAVKFTSEGGRVGILVSRTDNGELVIEVGDNGVGIDADKIKEVLDPFTVAEPVESRQHGGVGLGLSITKRLVESHDGSLSLRSQKDIGTIVTLTFPARRSNGDPRLINAS